MKAAMRIGLLLLFAATIPLFPLPSLRAAETGLFGLAPPEPGYRRQRAEFYGIGQYWHSDDLRFDQITIPDLDGNPVTDSVLLDLDDTGLGGFGLAFHINDHWTISGEFLIGTADYEATFAGSKLRGEMLLNSGNLNAQFNFLPGRLSPFVTGGLGYYYFDTGIPSGPPGWYCWWDYWWGYVCSPYAPTHTEFDFSLNAGAGLRWEVTDAVFLRASGGATWVDMRGSDWPAFLQASFAIGIKF